MGLTQDEVIQIIKFIEESRFNELHLEMGDLKLTIGRRKYEDSDSELEHTLRNSAQPVPVEKTGTKVNDKGPNAITAISSERDTQRIREDMEDFATGEGLVPIKSPTLGVFYKAPEPGAASFVEIGTLVEEDDTVCILEVMKLFTQIKAGMKGRITKICAEDSEVVEYGQVLFLVKCEETQKEGCSA